MKSFQTLPLLALAGLLSPVRGVVIRAFIGSGCQGYYQDINIYDNTCWTGPNEIGGTPFQSFYITTYGTGGQYVTAYQNDNCFNDGRTCQGAAAPGAAPLGTCYSFASAQAFGSAAACSDG